VVVRHQLKELVMVEMERVTEVEADSHLIILQAADRVVQLW
jgi:hypothetical protein